MDAPHALLQTPETPLVRTSYDDDAAWAALLDAVATPSADGFLADVAPVDDRRLSGLDAAALRALAGDQALLLVADEVALAGGEHLLLAVELGGQDRGLRVPAAGAWAVENDLSLANMDWEDFSGALDADGVYRAA